MTGRCYVVVSFYALTLLIHKAVVILVWATNADAQIKVRLGVSSGTSLAKSSDTGSCWSVINPDIAS